MLIPDEHPVLKIEKIPSLFEIPDHLLCYQLREGCCLSASWTNILTHSGSLIVFGLELGLGRQKIANSSVICMSSGWEKQRKVVLILIFCFNDF